MKRRLLPKWCSAFRDRHGKERIRFRRKGFETYYFQAAFGTEEFRTEYHGCLEGTASPRIRPGSARVKPGTIDALIARYVANPLRLGPTEATRSHNRGIIERFRKAHGHRLVADLEFEHLDAIFGAMAQKTPFAALKLRKQLKKLFRFAVRIRMRTTNPVDDTEPVRAKTDGFHTWTEAEIAQFEERHPLGTKARLALALMLWTGQRRGDAVRMRPANIRNGRIRIVQNKTGKSIWIAIAPQLRAAIDAMPEETDPFLVTEYGKPFTAAGFGNWFRARCNEADLPHCSAHGLRKAISRRLAEINRSNQSIKAVTGHSGDSEVALYTREADQVRMADEAIGALSEWELANQPRRLDKTINQPIEKRG